jgi:hypothetical protein
MVRIAKVIDVAFPIEVRGDRPIAQARRALEKI